MSDLRLILLGTGSPRPQLHRAGPSQVIETDKRAYLVDCGDGTTTRLLQAGVPLPRVTRLLFTHLHTDHTLGYGQFVLGGWAVGRRELTVFGPPGTRRLHRLLFEEAYRDDVAYRLSTGRDPRGLVDAQVRDVGPGTVLEEDGLRVTAAWMQHQLPTLAYRFDYHGRSIVISGDTAECPALVELARGADVLVQDCSLDPSTRERFRQIPEERRLWERIAQEHCGPEQAGRIAAAAGVRTLVLTHLMPLAEPGPTLAEARRAFSGEVLFGQDLLELVV